jgi:hypothetical protein
MPDNNFIPMKLSSTGETKLKRHLKMRIMALNEGLTQLHEDKITKWRKAYEAEPREKTREFPFYNASNLVVPIIAIFSDTLLARVMAAILKTRPPWACTIFGVHDDIKDEHRSALEEFMEYVGIEPEELDLYRVYHEWFSDTIKYGTSLLKCPHEVRYRDEVMMEAGDDVTSSSEAFMREVEYEGPRPEKIPFENFLVPPNAKTLGSCDIKIHKRQLIRSELEERRFFQIYEPNKVDEVLKSPDRTSPSYTTQMKEDTLGAHTTGSYGYAEWDIYECWLKWPTPDGKFRPRIVATYHKQTDTLLRAIYDTATFEPFVLARLFYRDDMIYGYGFCETMWSFQEEMSEQHNQRIDNRTIGNTRVWRASPDSKLHAGYRIYPSCLVPAEKDEIEALQAGDISPQTIEDERFSLELAERRAGISPPMQGAGAGAQGKRGIYTAMGTLSVMQEGNSRTDLNTSDLRYSHTRLGRILLTDYAKYGVRESLLAMFGEKGPLISKALEAVNSRRIGLPIYSSTASVNREVEKQNDVMLVNVLRQHYMGVANLIGQIGNMMTNPTVSQYLMQVIKASNLVMKSVLRNFQKEDIDLLVPEPKFPQPQQGQGGPGNEQTGQGPLEPNKILSMVRPGGMPGAQGIPQ